MKSKNIRPSIQRLRILDYLHSQKNHPTVDTIYEALHPEIPTLSRTTVYNTLQTFQKCHLVSALDFGDGSIHYDADTFPHIHFKCQECNAIHDVFVVPEDIQKHLEKGTILTSSQFYAFGICAKCAKKSR
ncbi:transcriptional repressor [uncultured Fibrobacter sp.]|uniref:Fur family transcriptional regulator n=1 Tax=uncultured Fibrobacter sp. TaxID=261512 RepID=UPI0028045045|nr:transcriptional repressor [uncultured Fibrobacter sp.]